MEGYKELISKLMEIRKRGYIKTHRAGNTGIGKTLEDLLGIRENNIPGPNSKLIELKSGRKNTSSMLTLLTKAPEPYGANVVLLKRFGYPSGKNDKNILHTIVNATEFNTIKGKHGFKISVTEDRVELLFGGETSDLLKFIGAKREEPEVVAHWTKETLRASFEKKYPLALLYVKADCKGRGKNEEFWFNEAWYIKGFNFDGLAQIINDSTIKVDIRIGQNPDGSTHDHGTGFRIFPKNLDLCFSVREQVI
ncbi:MAG: glycosyl hydrolase [Candidatus Aenigmarchaeota archaeon]|nr:glycosyl hydrolase [Candidatus Aenigmarchaeota archaeon]